MHVCSRVGPLPRVVRCRCIQQAGSRWHLQPHIPCHVAKAKERHRGWILAIAEMPVRIIRVAPYIKLDEENSHPTLDALRPLEQVLPSRRQLQPVAVPKSWDGHDPTQTACEPLQRNGLRQVLVEPVRSMQRASVTQAFPDAVDGAVFGLAQFGLQLPKRWAAEQAPEWIAAFLGSFASLVLCISFLTVSTETRAALVPPSVW